MIAGLIGGLVVFAWGAISHMVLPLGEMGISIMPNEAPVLEAMKQAVPSPGLYFFPGLDMKSHPSPEEEKAWEAKYQAGPTGILVFNPAGGQPLSPARLIKELLSNIAASLVAAYVVSRVAGGGLLGRAMMVGLLGLFAWLSISVSYWNWYGYPAAYTMGEGIDQFVGWFLGGLVIGKIAKPPAAR